MLRTGKVVNVYTHSQYAYAIQQAHLEEKRYGMLTVENKQMKHGLSILKLLEAVQLPEKVAVIHWGSHQKVGAEVIKGNNKVDATARRAALEPVK